MMRRIAARVPIGGRLLQGSALAFGIHVVGAGLSYLSQLALARVIGAEGFGLYASVLGVLTLLAYLAALGFDVSLLRFVPAYRAAGAWGLVRGVQAYAERRAATAGLCIAAVGALGARFVVGGATYGTFLAGFGLVPVYALLWIRCTRVRAFGGVASGLLPDRVVRDGLLLLATLAAWWLLPADWRGAPEAMLATLASALCGLLLASWFARRHLPHAVATAPPAYAVVAWRRTAFPLVAIAMAEVAMNRTGTLALAWSGHTADAGVYALAFNLAAVAILPRIAVNAQFAPMAADHLARGDRDGLQALVNQATLWTLLGAAAIAGAVLLAAPLLLLRWFGPDFAAAAPALAVLLAGQMVAGALGSQIFLLTMSGREVLAACVMAGFAAFGLVTAGLLAPRYGLVGAAASSSCALVGMNFMLAWFVWRRLGLRPACLGFLPAPAARLAPARHGAE
jgi:O-antigen/teichoic acid export membrane protein